MCTKTGLPTLRQVTVEHLATEPRATELKDRHDIDEYIETIIDALRNAVDASTPWSDSSPH